MFRLGLKRLLLLCTLHGCGCNAQVPPLPILGASLRGANPFGTSGTLARCQKSACQHFGTFDTLARCHNSACQNSGTPGTPARCQNSVCQNAGTPGTPAPLHQAACQLCRNFGTPPRGRVPVCQPCQFLARLPAAACQRANRARIFGTPPCGRRANRARIFGTPPRGRVPACQPCQAFLARLPTAARQRANRAAVACQRANRARHFWHACPRPRASVPTVPGIFGTPPHGREPARQPCQAFLARPPAAACLRANRARHFWHASPRPRASVPTAAAACQCANCARILAHLPVAVCQCANCARNTLHGANRAFWHAPPRPRASVPSVPEFLARPPAAACQRANRAGILARPRAKRAGIFGTPPRGRVPACQPCRKFGTPSRGRVPTCQACRNFWHASPRPRTSVPSVPGIFGTSPAAACERAKRAGILARLPAAACQRANRARHFWHASPRRVPACQPCRNFGTPPCARLLNRA